MVAMRKKCIYKFLVERIWEAELDINFIFYKLFQFLRTLRDSSNTIFENMYTSNDIIFFVILYLSLLICSGFYGVEFCEASHKWVAHVDLSDQKHVIGRYDTKEIAALQYNAVADRLKGAHLNLVEGENLAPTVVLASTGGVKATSKVSLKKFTK
jgi:hypothetical protein